MDIQPIAVQIAKLRCFISLIVDQKVNPQAENFGIRALPNLETKFVAANTLIGLERPPQQSLRDPEIDRLERELARVREAHFTAETPATKRKCRKRDEELRARIAELLKHDGWDDRTARMLAAWDPYDQNASGPFFDAEWMFGVTEGFDVVIGNPPYVRIQTLNDTAPDFVRYLKNHYAAARKGNYDLYVVFVEAGLKFLSAHGELAYILPHKFFNAQYGQPLRKVLSDGRHLRHVVHFGDQQIFPGATNYVCLLFLSKTGVDQCRWVRAEDLADWLATQHAPEATLPATRFTPAKWNVAVGSASRLFDKLQQIPVKLGDVADLFVGVQTDADDVFIVEEFGRKGGKLVCCSKFTKQEHEFEAHHLKPLLKGSLNIRRYALVDLTKRLIFPYETRDGVSYLITVKEYEQKFPLTWTYLKACRSRLASRAMGKFADFWHGYVYKKNHTRFEQPKLVVPAIGMEACFAADFDGNFYFVGSGAGGRGGYGILLKPDSQFDLRYLLAILNSASSSYLLKRISSPFRGGYFALTRQFISQLPIRPINFGDASDRAEHDAIVKLVERILAAKRTNPTADTSAWEHKIDERVYRLYGLTPDEIKLVEEDTRA